MNENERIKRATFKTKGKFRAVASVGASQFLLVLNGERVLRNGNSGTGTSNCSHHKNDNERTVSSAINWKRKRLMERFRRRRSSSDIFIPLPPGT